MVEELELLLKDMSQLLKSHHATLDIKNGCVFFDVQGLLSTFTIGEKELDHPYLTRLLEENT